MHISIFNVMFFIFLDQCDIHLYLHFFVFLVLILSICNIDKVLLD